jgi:hypothetical protein
MTDPFFAFYSFLTEPEVRFCHYGLRLSFPRTRESSLAPLKTGNKKLGFLLLQE